MKPVTEDGSSHLPKRRDNVQHNFPIMNQPVTNLQRINTNICFMLDKSKQQLNVCLLSTSLKELKIEMN